MKSVVCNAPFELRVVERDMPEVRWGEALLRIRRVGLCGTDYHIYQGNQPFLNYPRVMGHELAGEVVSLPVGSRFHVGQTVTVNPYLACGKCRACRKDKPNCCANISVLGVHADGGMAEYLAVPESALIDATGLKLEQAAMVEFLAIGAHAVSRSGVGPSDQVLVVGAGPIGIAASLFARIAGAHVTLVDSRERRLVLAREKLGFDDIFVQQPELAGQLADHTDGEMFDCVFDATGNIAAMSASLTYVANGGALVLVGVAKGDLVYADPEFHKRETTLIGSRNALSADFDQVIAAIRDGEIPTAALQTNLVKIDDISDEIPRLIAGADEVLKAVMAI